MRFLIFLSVILLSFLARAGSLDTVAAPSLSPVIMFGVDASSSMEEDAFIDESSFDTGKDASHYSGFFNYEEDYQVEIVLQGLFKAGSGQNLGNVSQDTLSDSKTSFSKDASNNEGQVYDLGSSSVTLSGSVLNYIFQDRLDMVKFGLIGQSHNNWFLGEDLISRLTKLNYKAGLIMTGFEDYGRILFPAASLSSRDLVDAYCDADNNSSSQPSFCSGVSSEVCFCSPDDEVAGKCPLRFCRNAIVFRDLIENEIEDYIDDDRLPDGALGYTPLAEMTYEVKKYFAGEEPWDGTTDLFSSPLSVASDYYRDDVSNSQDFLRSGELTSTGVVDKSSGAGKKVRLFDKIVKSGNYLSPFMDGYGCRSIHYVLLTDGAPYLDGFGVSKGIKDLIDSSTANKIVGLPSEHNSDVPASSYQKVIQNNNRMYCSLFDSSTNVCNDSSDYSKTESLGQDWSDASSGVCSRGTQSGSVGGSSKLFVPKNFSKMKDSACANSNVLSVDCLLDNPDETSPENTLASFTPVDNFEESLRHSCSDSCNDLMLRCAAEVFAATDIVPDTVKDSSGANVEVKGSPYFSWESYGASTNWEVVQQQLDQLEDTQVMYTHPIYLGRETSDPGTNPFITNLNKDGTETNTSDYLKQVSSFGQLYDAKTPSQLVEKFVELLGDIEARSSVIFAPPTFERTGSNFGRYIYVPMFRPMSNGYWRGNVKAFDVSDGDFNLVDSATGNGLKKDLFSQSSQNVACADSAGLGSKLKSSDLTGNLYYSSPPHTRFNDSSLSSWSALGFSAAGGTVKSLANATESDLFLNDEITVSLSSSQDSSSSCRLKKDNSERYKCYLLEHFYGTLDPFDTDRDDNYTETRDPSTTANGCGYNSSDSKEQKENDDSSKENWLIGDIIHSGPVIIQTPDAGKTKCSAENPGVNHLVFGSNDGLLYNFRLGYATDYSSISASLIWGFVPGPLVPRLQEVDPDNRLYGLGASQGNGAGSKPFLMDGQTVLIHDDTNNDGCVSSDEEAYLMYGFRQGGYCYQILDVKNIATDSKPQVHMEFCGPHDINRNSSGSSGSKYIKATSGFENLGQSWSVPVGGTAEISGNKKMVALFGGGNDPSRFSNDFDQNWGQLMDKTVRTGAAIYLINITDKTLIQKVDDSTIEFPVVAPISLKSTLLTRNVEKGYFGDIGGNLYRFNLDFSKTSPMTVTKVVDANVKNTDLYMNSGGIFHGVDIVSSSSFDLSGEPVDIVVFGTGNTELPLMGREKQSINVFIDREESGTPPLLRGSEFVELTEDNICNENLNDLRKGDKAGLFLRFGEGEKISNTPLTISGQVIFSTIRPKTPSDAGAQEQICELRKNQAISADLIIPLFGNLDCNGSTSEEDKKAVRKEDSSKKGDKSSDKVAFVSKSGDVAVLGSDITVAAEKEIKKEKRIQPQRVRAVGGGFTQGGQVNDKELEKELK